MKLEFTATIWKWPSQKAPWFFVSVPKKYHEKIKEIKKKGPWGSVSIQAQIKKSRWHTMITPAKEYGYIIPIRKEIRKEAGLDEGDKCKISITAKKK